VGVSDRSLDEFATGVDSEEGADVDGTGDSDPAPNDTASTEASPDPATPTMRWAVDAICDDCAGAVSRRWRDGDAFVCADCKEW